MSCLPGGQALGRRRRKAHKILGCLAGNAVRALGGRRADAGKAGAGSRGAPHETTSELPPRPARNHIGIPGLPRTKSSRNPPGTLHETASEFPLFRRSGVPVRADGGIPGPAAPLRPAEEAHFYGRDCPAENVKGQPLLGFPGRSGACLGIVCPAGAGFRRIEGRKIPCLPGMGPGGLG